MAKLINHNARIKDGQEKTLSVELTRHPFVVGADVDKHYVAFSVLFKQGTEHKSILRQYENYPANLQEALNWILELSQKHNPLYPAPPRLYLESTGVYHLLTIKVFGNRVIPTLINPKIIKDLLKSEGKDDHKDALTLAKLALSFDLRGSRIDTYEQYRLKKSMRYHRKLIQSRTQISNRIGSTLIENYLPLPNAIKMLSRTGKNILEAIIAGETNRAPLMKMVYGLPPDLINVMDSVCAGQLALDKALTTYWPQASRKQHSNVDKIYRALEMLPQLPQYVREVLGQMYQTAEHYEEQIDIAYKRVENLFDDYHIVLPETGEVRTATATIELLQTIPIFSIASAQALVAEAGLEFDYTYRTDKMLTRYLGLTPGSKKSGGKVISTTTVVGNSWFKPMIVQGAASFLRRKEVKVGQNLLDWGKEYQRSTDAQHARVALARIATKSAWHVVRTGQPYDDSRYAVISQTRQVSTNINHLSAATQDLHRTINPDHLNEKGLADLTQTALTIGKMVGLNIPRYKVLNFTSAPLENLGISKANLTPLEKQGITSTSDVLLHLISGSLPSLDGIGPKRFETILTALQTHQFIQIIGDTTNA